MFSDTVNYLIINAGCFGFTLIILFNLSQDVGSALEMHLFRMMLGVFLFYLGCDEFWELAVRNLLPIPWQVRSFVNGISLFSMALLSYFWFLFAEVRMRQDLLRRGWFIALTAAPILLDTTLLVTNAFTGLVYYSDETAEYHGPAYMLVSVIDMFYLLGITIHAARKAHCTHAKSKRREYFTMTTFVLFPFFAGVFDGVVPNTAIMSPCVFSALLLLYVSMQNAQIYQDALTGLNNRRSADQRLENMMQSVGADNGLVVCMIDVNRFKTINDRYGHMEGDRALQTAAKGLARIAGQYSVYVCRWGGDEFMMIGAQKKIGSPADFAQQIRDGVPEEAKRQNLPYDLSVSVGYRLCTSPEETSEAIVRDADTALYEDKRAFQSVRA